MCDCSNTYNYFAEKNRMTKSTCEKRCNISCHECPLSRFNNGKEISCRDFEMLHTKQAIFLVQAWCAEHPPKTYLSEFLQHYPNAELEEDGTPKNICPNILGLNNIESCEPGEHQCIACWHQRVD